MLDAAQRIPKRITLLLRARRAFLAFALALLLWLGLRLLGRVLGFSPPPELFLGVPVAAAAAGLWPLSVRWVRVGRRLGLGGKLAGLVAALRTPGTPFPALLASQITLRPWRLFFPEVLVLVPVLALAWLSFSFVPPFASPPPEPPPAAVEVRPEEESVALPSEEGRAPRARELPQLPSGFPAARPPYAELLAQLFGEDVPPEEVWERLSQEEGLLRRLAAALSEAAGAGWTEALREEFAEIVSELGRPDLRSALSAAMEGRGDLAEAQEIVSAALEGLAALREAIPAESSEGGAPSEEARSSASAGGEGPEEGVVRAPGEILLDTEAEAQLQRKLEEAEEGLGLGAGWEKGEPVRPGLPSAAPRTEEVLAVAVRSGEGPVRQGFALGLPGETPGADPAGVSGMPSGDAELLLGAKGLPAGLRELVRRYFQLLAEGGEP